MFFVSWSGKAPTLCSGEWVILKNGRDMSDKIPDLYRYSPMGTYGTYLRIDPNTEIATQYEDGKQLKDWLQQMSWVYEICDNLTEIIELYTAISKKDWRYEQCGGCI